ncbi:MAG: hypothetical protein ACRDPM_02220 [Solirubrobacteraceae bacterium]
MVSAVRRNPTRSRVGAILALVLAFLTVALGAASSATAAPPGVKVLDHDSNVLAVFRSANCVNSRKSAFAFQARAKSQGWTLDVSFWKDTGQFTGFHTYSVEFGVGAAITVSVLAPNRRTFYSTEYAPPNPPRSAGGLRLGPGGAIMGIGLFAVLAPDLQTGVALAGGLQCHYPRRRR